MNQLGYATGGTLGQLEAAIMIAVRSAALALFELAVVYGAALIATFGISVKHQRKPSKDSVFRQIVDGLA